MVCQGCGRKIDGKLGDLCPACEADQAARRAPAPTADEGATPPPPEPRQHRLLPGGDTGRLRELRPFIEGLHW